MDIFKIVLSLAFLGRYIINMKKLLFLFLLTGCHNFTRIPGQDRAEELVWRDTYGMSEGPPPIEWVTPPALDCGNRGFWAYLNVSAGYTCLWGIYYEIVDYARVSSRTVMTDDPFNISDTAYAHELYHAVLWHRTGNADPDHLNQGWQKGGILDLANQALKADGL